VAEDWAEREAGDYFAAISNLAVGMGTKPFTIPFAFKLGDFYALFLSQWLLVLFTITW
jgi:hypothetical protein